MTDEKVLKDLSVKISEYDFENSIFRQRWFVHLIFLLLAVIIGFMGFGTIFCYIALLIAVFLFIMRINKKQKLSVQKLSLLDELNHLADKIPIDKYLELKHKIINAGR
jgi:hypothetical protein